jgi:hypothetical protein
MAVGCTGDFAEMNTNPKALVTVEPESIFFTAQMETHTANEYWQEAAGMARWVRYGVVYYFNGSNQTFEYMGDGHYGPYNALGGLVTNIDYLVDNHENAAGYANLKAMARILLISDGISTSDMWGSLAYSEAWKARAGETDMALMEPKFQTQEELSAVWDAELKACIEILKTSTGQIDIAGNDRAYGGDAAQWVKAANGLRLRIASRLLKRDPATAKAIAAEVLSPANAEYVMSSTDDSFILWFENLYTNVHGGDWHSPKDLLGASDILVNFMDDNDDPRLRMFFAKNNLTPENIKAYNDWCLNYAVKNEETGKMEYPSGYDPAKPMDQQIDAFYSRYIPDGTPGLRVTDVFDLYTGGATDPTVRASHPGNVGRTLLADFSPTGEAINMRAANEPQVAIFDGSENGNTGINWFPTMTHADFCFLAAEFVLTEGVSSSKSAQAWYEEGVRSSLDQWNEIGKLCVVDDYTPMTEEEISAFTTMPDIAWAADAKLQLEQIRTQAWVDNFKNYGEAWAQWKRTETPGYERTIVTFDRVYWNNVELNVPRRAKFTTPVIGSQNEANLQERLDVMMADPEFGGLSNEFGRLWWDKE